MKINGVLTKSDNAIDAEGDGRYTITRAKKELQKLLPQLTLKQCQALLEETYGGEWHHVGSYANEVPYYDVADAKEWFEENPKDAEALFSTLKTSVEIREVIATIHWAEWGGSRKRPQKYEYEFEGKATIKGDWITFDYKMGSHMKSMRKKMSGNWITVKVKENVEPD